MAKPRFLVTGASGTLGCYLVRELQLRQIEMVCWTGSYRGMLLGQTVVPVDLTNSELCAKQFRECQPTHVIHAAAMAAVGDCYKNPKLASQINTHATQRIVELCQQNQVKLLYTSTDLVFDGEKGDYSESDATNPLSIYGRSKRDAESSAQNLSNGIVARISLLEGPSLRPERPSFQDKQMQALQKGEEIPCFDNEWRTPLSYAGAARRIVTLMLSDFSGLIHLGGETRKSRYEMGLEIAKQISASTDLVRPVSRLTFPGAEPRPKDTSLNIALWQSLKLKG